MRYGQTENTWLLGNLPPGGNVTIVIVDIDTDNAPTLVSNVCTESTKIPGLYMYDVLNNMSVSTYKNFAYEMTDGTKVFRGKFVYGGALPADIKSVNEEEVQGPDDLTGKDSILAAISLLNDISPSELAAILHDEGAVQTEGTFHSFLDTYANKGDYGQQISAGELHDALDSYSNKQLWQTAANITPVLDAIAALETVSLTDIENSTILAKEATLTAITSMIALIPTVDTQTDLTPVLNAIANLNDVTADEVRSKFNVLDFKDKNTEAEIHAWLDSYTNKASYGAKNTAQEIHTALDTYANKDAWKQAVTNLQPVLNAIADLNDIDLATIESSTVLAKQATLTTIINAIANIEVNADNVNVDLTPVLTAIENLNDVSALEVRAAFNAADFKDKNTQSEIHLWLDNYTNKEAWGKVNSEAEIHQFLNSYTNKSLWQAQINLTPVLNAIAALNDIDLATIEASTVLVKQTQLQAVADAVALIPTTSSTDLTPVLNAIANLNDVTPQDVRNAFNPAEFKDKNTENEIHTWLDTYANKASFSNKNTQADIHAYLDSYANKNDWKASLNLQPVLNAIASLNDIDLATIEGSAILAKEATLASITSLISAIETGGSPVDLTPVLNAIAGLNDVTAAEVRAAFNAADFKDKNTQAEIHAWLDSYANKGDFGDKNTQAEIHTWLDSYPNKNDWKANSVNIQPIIDTLATLQTAINGIDTDIASVSTALTDIGTDIDNIPTVDLSPIVNKINALNDISLADIEASTQLAKQSTLQTIVNMVAQIPTNNNIAVSQLQPVLDAIANLNDVTPQQVRAAFNAADFKDKNTQSEIHAWLDSYQSKGDWKGLTASQEAALISTSNIVNTISTTLSNVKTTVDTLPTSAEINASTPSDITNAVTSIIDSIPTLSNIRQEMIDVTFGGLEIANNQMTIKDKNGTVIAIFDLFDQNGEPTMCAVYKREVIS